MREIQSISTRMAGSPTFKNRRLTIDRMLFNLSQGSTLQEFADEYQIDIDSCNNALLDIADNLYTWIRPKIKWELWESIIENSHTFSTSENIADMFAKHVMPSDAERIWVMEARSYIEAQTKLHEYMGWKTYKPILDENGHPYSEDEGDIP
jgi:uncharacterized protein (DUF433 family)